MATLDQDTDDDGPIAAINIIPFVDIALVLLVVFMLTSVTIVRASLKVELPKAASGGASVASTLNLVYTRTQQLIINGQPVPSLREAAGVVKRAYLGNPKMQAVIAADRAVPYGRVVELIDLVKENGIVAFALDVENGPLPPAAP
ncbi:MAG TPA: biopolymer transporter ExbD [Polyangia bacterium]|nr:biopolymer transporter ExbD [Polyangia bacterium]